MMVGVCAVVETGKTSTTLAPFAVTTALPVPRSMATPVGMGSVAIVCGTASLTISTIEALKLPEVATTAKPACGYTATPCGFVPTASSGFAPKPDTVAPGAKLTMETSLHPDSLTTATLWAASMATPCGDGLP